MKSSASVPLRISVLLILLTFNVSVAGFVNFGDNNNSVLKLLINAARRSGGRSRFDFVRLVPIMLENTVKFYKNGKRFDKPIHELVTIHCRTRSTDFVRVRSERVAEYTNPWMPYVFVTHGWTDSWKNYYLRTLAKGLLN